jgi:hypothetical protein
VGPRSGLDVLKKFLRVSYFRELQIKVLGVVMNGKNIHTKFNENRVAGSKFETGMYKYRYVKRGEPIDPLLPF